MTDISTADVTIYQQEDSTVTVTVVDETGAIKDLTGGTVNFRIGSVRGEEFIFQKDGGLSTDGSDGKIFVVITAADTTSLPVQEHDYQFLVTDSGGSTQVVKDGTINVKFTLPTS